MKNNSYSKLLTIGIFLSLFLNISYAGQSNLAPCPNEYIVNKSIFGDGPDEKWNNCFGDSTYDSIRFIGEWQGGIPNGQGILINQKNNNYALGYWNRQRATGQVIHFDQNGKIMRSGIWDKGNFIREELVDYKQFDNRLSKFLTDAIRLQNKIIWENYFESGSARVAKSNSAYFTKCMKTGFTFYQLVNSTDEYPVEKPQDKVALKIEKQCTNFINSKELQFEKLLSPQHQCKVNNISSTCDYIFTADIESKNEFTEMKIQDIFQFAFKQNIWKVISKETEDGKNARLKTEASIAEKVKEKNDAAEKERRWKESPEYQRQLAEEQRLKKIQEEKLAQEAEQIRISAEKEAKKLRIKGFGLGAQKVPCTPSEQTYVDIMKTPKRLSNECSIGKDSDRITFIFDFANKNIVSITRIQFDQDPSTIIEAAVKFYGKPYMQSDKNWYAIYGTAHSPSKSLGSLDKNSSGIGLGIRGIFCTTEPGITGRSIEGFEWADGCNVYAAKYIKYELIDVEAYNKSVEDGTMKFQNRRKNSKDF